MGAYELRPTNQPILFTIAVAELSFFMFLSSFYYIIYSKSWKVWCFAFASDWSKGYNLVSGVSFLSMKVTFFFVTLSY